FFSSTPLTTVTYPLSLHDALPISGWLMEKARPARNPRCRAGVSASIEDRDGKGRATPSKVPSTGERTHVATRVPLKPRAYVRLLDRKSTRLNSSHVAISYAVFCLK